MPTHKLVKTVRIPREEVARILSSSACADMVGSFQTTTQFVGGEDGLLKEVVIDIRKIEVRND